MTPSHTLPPHHTFTCTDTPHIIAPMQTCDVFLSSLEGWRTGMLIRTTEYRYSADSHSTCIPCCLAICCWNCSVWIYWQDIIVQRTEYATDFLVGILAVESDWVVQVAYVGILKQRRGESISFKEVGLFSTMWSILHDFSCCLIHIYAFHCLSFFLLICNQL